jgi:transcriptional regulator with XRE-family HTH domain
MRTSKITELNTLTNKLSILGTYIRKIRSKNNISIEQLAQSAFLRAETIRKLEAGRCLPISDDQFRIIEKALGLKKDVLLNKAIDHRKYLVEFIELYHDQIIAMVDALRIYSSEEIDRILNETKFKWTSMSLTTNITNLARKEGDIKMATTRRTTTAAKPAVKKAAPKRSTAKVAPMKRSTASKSTAKRSK